MTPGGLALSGVVTRYPASARVFDVLVTVALLPLVGPAALLVALAVALDSPGPVLFRSLRVGRDGRFFRMLKFRTMRHLAPGASITSAGDSRYTPLGRLLAVSRLDELPQLWNVLRGEMRLVGPRPEIREFVSEQAESYREILSVPPGVTGPTQLAFADEGKLLAIAANPAELYARELLPEKVKLDLRYVDSGSRVGDLALIARTWVVPVRRLALAWENYPRSTSRAGRSLVKAAAFGLATLMMVATFAVQGAAGL